MASELTVQTIQGPASGANANKILIPSGQKIIAEAGGLVAPGQVIQVVQGVFQSYTTTTSTSAVATGLTASITPKFSTSKILINVFGSNQQVTSGTTNIYPLYKNGSVLDSTFMIWSAPTPDGVAMSASYFDNPATTSALTYALYFRTENGGYTASFGSNTAAGSYRNSITLMEIAQ